MNRVFLEIAYRVPLEITKGAFSNERILLTDNKTLIFIDLRNNATVRLRIKDNVQTVFTSSIDDNKYVLYYCDINYLGKIYYGDVTGNNAILAQSYTDITAQRFIKPINPSIKGNFIAYQKEYINPGEVTTKLYIRNMTTGQDIYVDNNIRWAHCWGSAGDVLYYWRQDPVNAKIIMLMK